MKREILIVDGDEPFVELLKTLFGGANHDTFSRASGLETLEIIKKTPPDLVVFGDSIADMDSITYATKVRQIRSKMPLVFLPSKYPPPELYRLLTKTLKVDVIAQRPLNSEILRAQIQDLLAYHRTDSLPGSQEKTVDDLGSEQSAPIDQLKDIIAVLTTTISQLREHPSDSILVALGIDYAKQLRSLSFSLAFDIISSEASILENTLESCASADQPIPDRAWLIIDLALGNAQKELYSVAPGSSN